MSGRPAEPSFPLQPAFGTVACLHAAVTKSRQKDNRNRPRVGMLAQMRDLKAWQSRSDHAYPRPVGLFPAAQVSNGRVKACHPILQIMLLINAGIWETLH